MEQDSNTLLLLGGKANPKGRIKYDISGDSWDDLTDLPFDIVNAACLSVVIKGVLLVLFSWLHAITISILQMTASSTGRIDTLPT